MDENAILALEDGSVFYGKSIGASGVFEGEIVFNTSHTGYQEILTDPSYAGQIIVFTAPHIGNVGINEEDMESDRIWAGGMVARSYSNHTGHWRSQKSLKSFLEEQNVIGMTGVDTRALIHVLRNKGQQMASIIAGGSESNPAACKKMDSLSCDASKFNVVVVDFGVKRSILKKLLNIGCKLTVLPAATAFDQIAAFSPDGVVLSNGPGDPAACMPMIHTIQELLEHEIPLFGICLGHQLLALASGAQTTKMMIGHHGANHPIMDMETKKVSITSQNHQFVVSEEDLPKHLKITHRSVMDGTIAGLCRVDKPAFGFQGHPEASPGPHDLFGLFERFAEMMEKFHAKKN